MERAENLLRQVGGWARRHLLGPLLAAGLMAGPLSVLAEGLEIWFVRHAESEINRLDGPAPLPDDGVSYPLTARGVGQAVALGERFADRPVLALYSSTRLRTLQTADAISFHTGVPVTLSPELVEIRFDFDEEREDGLQQFAELTQRWAEEGDFSARVGEGESLAEVRERFLPFWKQLQHSHGEDSGLVVAVSHGGLLMTMLPLLCDNGVSMSYARENALTNTGVVKARLRQDRLLCTEWDGRELKTP